MIRYFPDIYPDELIYSLLSRFYIQSGYMSYTYAAENLFEDKRSRPDMEYLNCFTANAMELITNNISKSDLILQHTMFPYYGRFIKNPKEAYYALLSDERKYHRLLPKNRGKIKRYLRYCPLCSREDRARYGETYWHRIHQMSEIDCCLIHNCKLINSNIIISHRSSPKLVAADCAVPKNESDCSFQTESVLFDLNQYMLEAFNHNIDFNNSVQAGDYISEKLSETKYIRLKLRNVELLTYEYNLFYNTDIAAWQIQKILTNSETRFKRICMLAMFLGISSDEICHPCLTKFIKKDKKRKIYTKKPGKKPRDWEQFDIETLPKVKESINFMLSEEKPQKVSVSAIGKMLGLSSKQIEKMPKCKSEILEHYETQEQYWARKVKWAIKSIDMGNKKFNWKQIRNLTNIRKVDLYSCLPYIEDEICIRICEIL